MIHLLRPWDLDLRDCSSWCVPCAVCRAHDNDNDENISQQGHTAQRQQQFQRHTTHHNMQHLHIDLGNIIDILRCLSPLTAWPTEAYWYHSSSNATLYFQVLGAEACRACILLDSMADRAYSSSSTSSSSTQYFQVFAGETCRALYTINSFILLNRLCRIFQCYFVRFSQHQCCVLKWLPVFVTEVRTQTKRNGMRKQKGSVTIYPTSRTAMVGSGGDSHA